MYRELFELPAEVAYLDGAGRSPLMKACRYRNDKNYWQKFWQGVNTSPCSVDKFPCSKIGFVGLRVCGSARLVKDP
jgi:hypothetical protein